jgi:hypothetical protein
MGNSSTVEEKATGTKTAVVDRRHRRRFGVDGFAEVVVSETRFLFRGKIRDLSLNGCYVMTKAYLSVALGTEIELRFSVDDVHFRARAKVRVVKPGFGAGFEFLIDDPRIQTLLANLINKLRTPAKPSEAITYEATKGVPPENSWK